MAEKEIRKVLVFDDSDYAKKEQLELKADKIYVVEELIKKQDKLIYSGDNQNIATVNGKSLEGKKNISVGGNPFTELELQKIRSILDNFAFGYNKATGNFQQFGTFSEQTVYSDLDKPDDNIVTDKIGNPKEIRKVNFAHYSGNAWYGEDGKTISLRDYQNKLTYQGNEIALKKDVSPWIKGEYKWMPFGSTMPTGWKPISNGNASILINSATELDNLFTRASREVNNRESLLASTGPSNYKVLPISADLWQYDPK